MATLVGIIIAVVVLVVVIYGFTSGWNNVWGKITNIGNIGEDNIGVMKTSCLSACSTNDEYSFCTLKRNLVYKGFYTDDNNNEKSYIAKGSFSCNDMTKTLYINSTNSNKTIVNVTGPGFKELNIEVSDCSYFSCS